jgi:hypothetical protein
MVNYVIYHHRYTIQTTTADKPHGPTTAITADPPPGQSLLISNKPSEMIQNMDTAADTAWTITNDVTWSITANITWIITA